MKPAFVAFIRKDILLFFTDPKAVLMSIAAPIAIASFFGYVFNTSGGGAVSRIQMLVADQDSSAISRAIVARLESETALSVKASTLEAARETVRRGKAAVAVCIPKGFGEAASYALFRAVNKPEITLLTDPSRAAESGMVKGILTGTVVQVVSQESMSGAGGSSALDRSRQDVESSPDMPEADKRPLLDMLSSLRRWRDHTAGRPASPGLSIPFTTRDEAVTSRRGVQYNSYSHAFAGMGVQFVLFLGIEVGIGMLYLRQRGLWRRFRAAPLSRATLLGSRAASAMLISMFILLTVFAFGRVVFNVRFEGSFGGFLVICAAFSLMTAAFGLLIAALGNAPEVARGLAIVLTLFLVMLGGAWVPAFFFPPWLQKLTLVVPTRWAMDGLDGVTWRGLGLWYSLTPAAVLLGFALLFGTLAVWFFRWESD
jgi:ABC-2 type transport system permease protein